MNLMTATREELRAEGLTDEQIDDLWACCLTAGAKSIEDMKVDGTAHPDPNSGPPSHFGGEIGDKIPFEGLKGLNRKESLVIPKSGVWKVGGRLQELKEGTIIEWLR